jgi:hypothetical protein
MNKPKRETDTQLLVRARKVLGFTHAQMAELMGVTPAGYTLSVRRKSAVNPLARASIERTLMLHQLREIVKQHRIQEIPPCRGHTIKEIGQFADHLQSCPMCITRAFTHITGGK